MSKRKPIIPTSPGRRSVLSLYVGSAMALLATAEAHAALCLSLGNTQTVTGATTCINWSGGNLTLTNGGELSSSSTPALTASATAGTLTNNGTISGSGVVGLLNNANSLTVINSSFIHGGSAAIHNDSAIVSLINNNGGTISGVTKGIVNNGVIGELTNQAGGFITATGSIGTISAIDNAGMIVALGNSGLISSTLLGIHNTGSITSLINNSTGTIAVTGSGGAINRAAIFNDGGTIGSLTNSGTVNADSNYGVNNTGLVGSFNNTVSGTLAGIIHGDEAGVVNSGTIMSFNNSAAITGSQSGLFNDGGLITMLNNSGLIDGGTMGIKNSGSIGTLSNAGTGIINGTSHYGVYNTSTITLLSNDGTITGGNFSGVSNDGGTIGTVINNGVISGKWGLYNGNAITSISNSGTIIGTDSGIQNYGSIGTLVNSGAISGLNGIYNGSLSTISSLINSGTISGSTYGIQSDNNSSITSLTNASSGIIRGKTGILVGQLTPSGTVSVGTLSNAGSISGSTNVGVGTSANGTIGSLINSGIIMGANGIGNAGTIGSLNNSGAIYTSGYAIYNQSGASLGPITNSGLIVGTIANYSSTGLTINGGSGSTFGVLTGAGGSIDSASMGVLLNTTDNLYFNSGNLLLNDNVNVGAHSLSNTGATLQVNNHVNITGNYDQGSASTLLIGVGDSAVSNGVLADTGYGRLVVSGAATIASGSSVSLKALNSYGFATGQRYVVVQAATNGTDYNASSLVYSAAGYSGAITGSTLIDGSTSNLLLTLGSGGPSLPATTPNAISAISGLFNYNGTDASLLNVFNASATLGSSAEANRAGAQLNPAWSSMAASQASAAPTQAVLNVAGARLDGLRIAQSRGGSSGVATGESGSDGALWGQVFGGKATQDERDDISGYSANYSGLLLGSDRALNDAWRVGGLFSYATTSVDGKDDNAGSSVNLKSYGLIPYASYTADDWYLNLSGGVVRHKYDTKRLINFTGVNGVANGSYNGLQSVLSAQAGYPIRLDEQTVLTPIAGLNYSRLKQDGYTESGGNGAALSVESSKSSSLTSDLGGKLERWYDTSYGRLTPSVQLTWRHEYRDTRMRSVANYALDTSGSTSFTAYGPTPTSDTGIMALAATLARKDNLSVTARYTVEAASGYMGQTADLRLRYEF